MGQRLHSAAVKDAQIKLRKEEYALDMGQLGQRNYAVAKDVQIKLSNEECAEGTGYIAIHTMNLRHLDQNTRRLL